MLTTRMIISRINLTVSYASKSHVTEDAIFVEVGKGICLSEERRRKALCEGRVVDRLYVHVIKDLDVRESISVRMPLVF